MLSICLPVYRYDVRPLVAELLRQAGTLTAAVEILVYDDASPDEVAYGKADLRLLPGIRYVELPRNIGRAAIRNKMAMEATYQYLLMLDADGAAPPRFLKAYLESLPKMTEENVAVIVGGREYARQRPTKPYQLHWYYGHVRESHPAGERNLTPYLGFQSNNFLVKREVLLSLPFSERVTGYGHEDTLWGQELAAAGHQIHHLDNPVIHLGLETTEVFLRKQKQAVKNLHYLKSIHPHLRTRLTDLIDRYPRLTRQARRLPEKQLRRLLLAREEPSLYMLDLLKLRWWTT